MAFETLQTRNTMAFDIIKSQKLAFSISEYITLSVTIYAPYGVYDPVTKKIVQIRSKIDNGYCRMEPPLPDYLAPLNNYLFSIMRRGQSIRHFERNYIDPLHNASWEWMKDELKSGIFGHFDKIVPPNVDPLYQQYIPYFVHVVTICYLILKTQVARDDQICPSAVGHTLDKLYLEGPNPHQGRLVNGAIGVDEYGDNVYSQWGQFCLYGPCLASAKGIPDNFKVQGFTILSYNDISLPQNLKFANNSNQKLETFASDEIRAFIKTGWQQIRDTVFYQIMLNIQQEN